MPQKNSKLIPLNYHPWVNNTVNFIITGYKKQMEYEHQQMGKVFHAMIQSISEKDFEKLIKPLDNE